VTGNVEKKRQRRAMGGGAAALLIVALPLWNEFSAHGAVAWNFFLAIFLAGLVAAAVLLQRYFVQHAGEIGEARFDTRNKSDVNG
jgi:cobalamin biosynthesis protein CobD/CbiB